MECAHSLHAFRVPERQLRITQPSAFVSQEAWFPGFAVHFVWNTPLVGAAEATCSIRVYR